jgi:hypothetical protein
MRLRRNISREDYYFPAEKEKEEFPLLFPASE